jgi:transcriptional regulator with XRE-family HTH domain
MCVTTELDPELERLLMPKNPRGHDRLNGEELSANYDSYMHLIGPALKTVRILQGKSQEWLAECLSQIVRKKVDQAYVSKVESGKSRVSNRRLDLWCRVLKSDPLAVMSLAKSMSKDPGEKSKADPVSRRRRSSRQVLASGANGSSPRPR